MAGWPVRVCIILKSKYLELSLKSKPVTLRTNMKVSPLMKFNVYEEEVCSTSRVAVMSCLDSVLMAIFIKRTQKTIIMITEQNDPVRVLYSDSDLYRRNWEVPKKSKDRKNFFVFDRNLLHVCIKFK